MHSSTCYSLQCFRTSLFAVILWSNLATVATTYNKYLQNNQQEINATRLVTQSATVATTTPYCDPRELGNFVVQASVRKDENCFSTSPTPSTSTPSTPPTSTLGYCIPCCETRTLGNVVIVASLVKEKAPIGYYMAL